MRTLTECVLFKYKNSYLINVLKVTYSGQKDAEKKFVCITNNFVSVKTFLNHTYAIFLTFRAYFVKCVLNRFYSRVKSIYRSLSFCRGGSVFEWSSCSQSRLKHTLADKTCLLDVPRDEDHYSHPKCGNKIVEEDEECDCGTSDDCDRFNLVLFDFKKNPEYF